ncbi:MAG: hypothetical protein KBE09_01145 [Candidatus Pacebacteria bacterium]|nr:hypothetical protein [Candidatus Paceibacterota bacterium]
MNTSGIIGIGIGLALVVVMRSIRSLRADIAELKSSLVLILREIESHEWKVSHFEPQGKWREDMLAMLADAKHALTAAQQHAVRVHLSPKMRRRTKELRDHGMAQLRQYQKFKRDTELWRVYLSNKQISEIPHA